MITSRCPRISFLQSGIVLTYYLKVLLGLVNSSEETGVVFVPFFGLFEPLIAKRKNFLKCPFVGVNIKGYCGFSDLFQVLTFLSLIGPHHVL